MIANNSSREVNNSTFSSSVMSGGIAHDESDHSFRSAFTSEEDQEDFVLFEVSAHSLTALFSGMLSHQFYFYQKRTSLSNGAFRIPRNFLNQ